MARNHPKPAEADAQEPREIVVFQIITPSQCSQCKDELGKESGIILEEGQPLCLECADLDHLDYLPSGNAALTRRAKKYSALSAVVVRFSRARKRYERQGILVQPEALDKAEAECLADEELRMKRREREAERRARQDEAYREQFAARIGELWPGCPKGEAKRIAEHACLKHSGRVGRSADAKQLEEYTVDLAVRAAIRHRHTNYDELLMGGLERHEAREMVQEQAWQVEEKWRRG